MPSAEELFPLVVPHPQELSEWERNPCTLALSQMFRRVLFDERMAATDEGSIKVAEGLERAFNLVNLLRDGILAQKNEGDDIGDTGTDS